MVWTQIYEILYATARKKKLYQRGYNVILIYLCNAINNYLTKHDLSLVLHCNVDAKEFLCKFYMAKMML